MAKSIRSKIKRKFRAIKREKNAVFQHAQLIAAVNHLPGNADAPLAPVALPEYAVPKTSGFSFWSVIESMKPAQDGDQSRDSAMHVSDAHATVAPSASVRSATRTEMETDEAAPSLRAIQKKKAAAKARKRHPKKTHRFY